MGASLRIGSGSVNTQSRELFRLRPWLQGYETMIALLVVVLALLTGSPATNPWIEPARDVLVQACGSCHRPNLPTSNPRALAVFNLHEPVWYATMTDDQLRSLSRRIQGAKVEESDRDIVNSFVNCKLTGACSDARPQESP
jgi:hypothetical protein